MSDEQYRAILESHHIFMDGAFGEWLIAELKNKVEYYQRCMLRAESWDDFVEYRSRYVVTDTLYNMVLNPQSFF